MSPRRADPLLTARRREALVRAGYGEILEKGIQDVTLDGVVARAGSSKGGALHYFRRKEDLLYGVLVAVATRAHAGRGHAQHGIPAQPAGCGGGGAVS